MAETINAPRSARLGFLTIPAVVVSLLPILGCPLCWSAYAALLSSLGLGFLGNSAYLLPLTGGLLAVAVGGLGLQIKRAGYGPFALGVASAGVILAGKFMMASNLTTYLGVGLPVIASVWSMIPSRAAMSDSCSSCDAPANGARQRS
jgi:mercuric ion transport protein